MLKQKLHIITSSNKTKYVLLFATIGVCVIASVLSIRKINNADVIGKELRGQKTIQSLGVIDPNSIKKFTVDELINKITQKYKNNTYISSVKDVTNVNETRNREKLEQDKKDELLAEKKVKTDEDKKEIKKKPKQVVSRGGNHSYHKQTINIVASFYSGREAENGVGNAMKNALGGTLDSKTIAVPRNIKLGTKIKLIDENGNETIKIAKDYGNTKYIKWIDSDTMKIDICIPYASREELMKLGIKKYKGEIIRWGFDD